MLKSCSDAAAFPTSQTPEIAFIGRSNVGKSSLINIIGNSLRACVSKLPGQTKTIDFYYLDKYLCLVDLPGYGFAFAPEAMKSQWPDLVCPVSTLIARF